MRRPREREIGYVFGGQVDVVRIGKFLTRHEKDWTPQEYQDWERDPLATAVQAIVNPRSDVPRLGGVLFLSFQRRHIRIEHLLVDPSLRSKRVATNMFYRLVHDPRSQSFASISAQCPDNNDAAIAWLRSLNFRAISVIPGKRQERDRYLFTWSFEQKVQTADEVDRNSGNDGTQSDRHSFISPDDLPDSGEQSLYFGD